MSKVLQSIVLLAVLSNTVFASDMVWTNSASNNLWVDANNWNPKDTPKLIYQDKAKIVRLAPNDARLNAGHTGECQWLVIGDNASGELTLNGGTLNISGVADSWAIIAYGSTDVGILTVNDGTITTSNRVFVGFQGNGTINMNGGTMNIGGTFGIGYGEGFTTGRGTVNLAGGTINVAGTFTMSSPAGCVGKLDITGGTLNLTGDKRSVVEGYIANGYIVAYNGLGIVNVAYDEVKTIVTGAVDPTRAKVPYPANNAADAPPYAVLTWIPGYATTHDIYFGTDANAVRDATIATTGIYQGSQPLGMESFEPSGLELGKKYYWRIDEVNNTELYKGNLWQFTVADFALVDDFEKYADTAAMSASWANGSTGATLSLAATGGHNKAKTMKLDYNNSAAPYYSEAQIIDADFDWTGAGVQAIDIWYKGNAANSAAAMYAALDDKNGNPIAVITNSDADAVKAADWTVWRIALSDFAGVNLSNVSKFYVGVGSRSNPVSGGSGTVYFDDIGLYPPRCIEKPLEDLNDDCIVDFKDFAIMARNWLLNSPM
ncbi:MAG TPA: hypothetical protein DDX75_13535 [Phycisphaerales bacterium]|nr:hypothetical protein [Phycisphaerales bacterium]